jgi:hypothetical protein
MKKYFLMATTLLLFELEVNAQNNAIFFGGAGDGQALDNYAQNSNLILFEGGAGDGWSQNAYAQLSNEIYIGGAGDGWSQDAYAQSSTDNVYHGGAGDGFDMNSYSQSSNLILFRGGNGDGWANTYSVVGPLPVTLTLFEARKLESSVQLEWETSAEINSSHYIVEKSADAVNFGFLAEVKSENNPNGAKYNLIDEHPMRGYNYYRIKMVDIDGKSEYTPTRHVIFDGYESIAEIKIYPNPSQGKLYVEIPILRNLEPMVVNITNSFGQVIRQQKTDTQSKILEYDLSSLAKGVYYIQVKSKSFQKVEKVVLN